MIKSKHIPALLKTLISFSLYLGQKSQILNIALMILLDHMPVNSLASHSHYVKHLNFSIFWTCIHFLEHPGVTDTAQYHLLFPLLGILSSSHSHDWLLLILQGLKCHFLKRKKTLSFSEYLALPL